MPCNDYKPGALLPPHLSPFVVHQAGDYVPDGAEQPAPVHRRAPIKDIESEEEKEEEENLDEKEHETELAAELRGEAAAVTVIDGAKKMRNKQNNKKKKQRKETKVCR